METALEVLSRAATMVQDSANESRLATKELPTAKWRRERRLRIAHDYHHHPQQSAGAGISGVSAATPTNSAPSTPPLPLPPQHTSTPTHSSAPMSMMIAAAAAAATMRPLCEATNRPTPPPATLHQPELGQHRSALEHNLREDSPLDMSVSSALLKQQQRASPPPPYREPLPGTAYATTLARPSVITQAPSKRLVGADLHDSAFTTNRENGNCNSESVSICETVIDEHFRRSLGADYVALFGKKSLSAPTTPSPQPSSPAALPPSTAPPLSATPAHQQPPTLITPKPTAMLLSPTLMDAQELRASTVLIQQQRQKLQPPPQEEPLALQRHAVAVTLSATAAAAAPAAGSKAAAKQQRAVENACSSAATAAAAGATVKVHVKTEPDVSVSSSNIAAATLAVEPIYASDSPEAPSVDDHFAKALGETWKQLQAAGMELKK